MCLIPNGNRDGAVWIARSNPATSKDYTRKVDKPDELLARILDDVARMKKREVQLRRKTRDLRTRVAKCIEVGSGIIEYLLWTVN